MSKANFLADRRGNGNCYFKILGRCTRRNYPDSWTLRISLIIGKWLSTASESRISGSRSRSEIKRIPRKTPWRRFH